MGKKVIPCLLMEASHQGVVQSQLQPGLLSLCFVDVRNHTPHVPQQFCPSRLQAPQFRLWLTCQPTVLSAVPSPVPQAAGDAELHQTPAFPASSPVLRLGLIRELEAIIFRGKKQIL